MTRTYKNIQKEIINKVALQHRYNKKNKMTPTHTNYSLPGEFQRRKNDEANIVQQKIYNDQLGANRTHDGVQHNISHEKLTLKDEERNHM